MPDDVARAHDALRHENPLLPRPGRVGRAIRRSDVMTRREVKASRLGSETKMHHFGYIGDAKVGKRVNIGAGTITMNYTAARTK